MARTHLDLNGKRFGKLTATNQMELRNGASYRLCHCDCGVDVWILTHRLINKSRTGCGLKCGLRLPQGRAARNKILDIYKRGAKSRKLCWRLTDAQFDFLTSQSCHFCGRSPRSVCQSKNCNGVFIYNGIDRLNNELGYTLQNTVACCRDCNRAKSDMSLSDFMCWMRALTAFQEKQL